MIFNIRIRNIYIQNNTIRCNEENRRSRKMKRSDI